MARLVLIETGGNQEFIFATNKLRQNIGASELIHRIGTTFVLGAVATHANAYGHIAADLNRAADGSGPSLSTEGCVKRLKAIAEANPLSATTPIEVLVATSGKAVLLVDRPETGEKIIREVTLRALREAPGATVRGVIDEVDVLSDPQGVTIAADRDSAHRRMKEVHRALDGLRLQLPPAEARFPVLPLTALCATSGLPAEHEVAGELLAEPALCKRNAAEAGWRRVKASLGPDGNLLARDVGQLEKMDLDWFGVVHADGNGFGKVFLDLAQHMPDDGSTARDYFDFYRNLSFSLDLAGVVALGKALAAIEAKPARQSRREFLPVVPLVFGGDDLTVICEGRQAISFAEVYLRAFEEVTSAPDLMGVASVIPKLVDRGTRNKKAGFGGGAGIAVVKPHHPFHRAYQLAEELMRSAKTTKTILTSETTPNVDAISALDFQIVFEDAASDLDKLRKPWSIGDTRLHNRPYVVSDAGRLALAESAARWLESHTLEGLKRAVAELHRRAGDDSDRPALPRSQQHMLRSALFAGNAVADARLALIRERYDQSESKLRWEDFGDRPDSLFYCESERGGVQHQDKPVKRLRRTRFLDALEMIDLDEVMVLVDEADEVGRPAA